MIRWFLILVLIIGLAFVGLSLVSRKQPKTGLAEGRLRTCPGTPNCVCSEDEGKSSFVAPLPMKGKPEIAWEVVKDTIRELGGTIEKEENGYLWATFTTRFFRFVDDVELKMDEGRGVIHIRSASRVGYSDMGMNRRRVETIRVRFQREQR